MFGEFTFFKHLVTKSLANHEQISQKVVIYKYKLEWFQFGESRMICQIHQTFLLYGVK